VVEEIARTIERGASNSQPGNYPHPHVPLADAIILHVKPDGVTNFSPIHAHCCGFATRGGRSVCVKLRPSQPSTPEGKELSMHGERRPQILPPVFLRLMSMVDAHPFSAMANAISLAAMAQAAAGARHGGVHRTSALSHWP